MKFLTLAIVLVLYSSNILNANAKPKKVTAALQVVRILAQILEREGRITPESTEPHKVHQIGLVMQDVVFDVFNYTKEKYLNEEGTYKMSFWPINQEMKEANVLIKGFFKDVFIENLNGAKVMPHVVDVYNLTTNYSLDFDYPVIAHGLYRLEGEVLGQTIEGEGSFRVEIYGMTCSGSNNATVDDNGYIQINSMENKFDLQDIKVEIKNLKLGQFSDEELQSLIATAPLYYIKEYKDYVARMGAPIVIKYLNEKIQNKKITELWRIIHEKLEEWDRTSN